MLELRKGIDILADGRRRQDARGGAARCSPPRWTRPTGEAADHPTPRTPSCASPTPSPCARPREVFVVSGSAEDAAACRAMSLDSGEECPLAMKDHTLHFDLPEDQGRMVDQTYYIANEGEEVSVLAKKMLRAEALAYIRDTMGGIMKGKTLFVGFYNRGPVGAQAAIPGLDDLQLRLRPAQREHPLPQRLRPVRRRGATGRRVLHERAQPGHQQVGGHPQGAHLHGPELVHHLQHVLHLRGQHAHAEEGQPPLRRGSLHLLPPGEGALRAHVHHRHDRAGRAEDLLRRRRPVGLRQDDHGHGGDRLRRGRPCADVDRGGRHAARRESRDRRLWHRGGPQQGRGPVPVQVHAGAGDGGDLVERAGGRAQRARTGREAGKPLPPRGNNFQGDWWPGKTDKNGKPVPISNANARITLTNTAIGNYNQAIASDPAGRSRQGHHLQREGQRHHAARVGGEEPRPRRGRSAPPSSPRPPPRRWAPRGSAGSRGPTPRSSPARWGTTWRRSSCSSTRRSSPRRDGR